MQARNQDVALTLGTLLFGAGVAFITKVAGVSLAGSLLVSVGLTLILGLVVQRILADRPPAVKGDIGFKILDPEFTDSGVQFTVAFRAPVTTGLWIACDVPGAKGTACAKQWRDGEGRLDFPTGIDQLLVTGHGKRLFVWVESFKDGAGCWQR